MDTLTAFSIVALAALIHASFQLGVSMITLLSGHTAGKKVAAKRSFHLVTAFLWGTMVMTLLIVATTSYIASTLLRHGISPLVWSVLAGALIAVGIAVWVCYYRRGDGTSLWLPRPLARFLDQRIRATTLRAESFSLGLTGVFAEVLFILAPASAAAFAITFIPTRLQLIAVLCYVLIASLGTILVTVLIGSGHSLNSIQVWRERNRKFLQFAAGSGLVILGFYLYVNQVVTPAAIIAGVH